MQLINPNYNWENGVKQIQITEENLSQSCILCQLLRTKTLASGSKWIKHFYLFLPLFALHLLNGCDLFNMASIWTYNHSRLTLVSMWNSGLREKFKFSFQEFLASIDKISILAGSLGTRLSFMRFRYFPDIS